MKTLYLIAGAALVLAGAALAQTGKPASAGIYSKGQAARGAALYEQTCTRCHGSALEGADVIPPLSGGRFIGAWVGQPVSALTTRIRTSMPADMPGQLGLAATADITAYIFQANGYPAGDAEMPAGNAGLQALTIDAPK